jgi:hypothetical protein
MDSFLHKAEAMARGAASQTIDKAASEAGFTPWGNETAYGLKNSSTGMFLAAHKYGELVAEDDTTAHHDLVWRIFARGALSDDVHTDSSLAELILKHANCALRTRLSWAIVCASDYVY